MTAAADTSANQRTGRSICGAWRRRWGTRGTVIIRRAWNGSADSFFVLSRRARLGGEIR